MIDDEAPDRDLIRQRHASLVAKLRSAAEANGHDADALRIVAVTKGWPVEVARAALDAGLEILGENRVQEAEPKVAALPDAEWHFIGRLQANKARRAVNAFATIHSIDSIELLERAHRLIHDEGRRTRLLLQVNISGEAAKAGVTSAEALQPVTVAAVREAGIIGLMTMAPMGASDAEARAVFRGLRELRDRLQQAAGIELPELSMGMSADAEAAAAEGATLVRIGTALFGPRDGTAGILRQ
jgi:pyridoxal phosphate enzyme (YggS family)